MNATVGPPGTGGAVRTGGRVYTRSRKALEGLGVR